MSETNNTESQALKELAKIVGELTKQNRSRRRWRLFLMFVFVMGVGGFFYTQMQVFDIEMLSKKDKPFVAEVVLSGEIAAEGTINADTAHILLKRAFSEQNAKAVVLRINSPGGSPVQANRIRMIIKSLRVQYPDKRFYVVIEDICASGCYFIASAADEIYADKSSIIGSIGVVISTFGAVELMDKIGIERRLYTAGKDKGFLDPFSPTDPKTIAHIQQELLVKGHQHFIEVVREGRGDRLSENEQLFSGLVWMGEKSLSLGLIDEIGNTQSILDKLGIENRVEYRQQKPFLEQLIGEGVHIFTDALVKSVSSADIKRY